MYKKVSESQKKEILEAFTNGEKIKDLSKKFGFSSPTISRQLKSLLGEDEFHNMKNGNSRNKANKVNLKQENEVENYKVKDSFQIDKQEDNSTNNVSFETNEEFYEIQNIKTYLEVWLKKMYITLSSGEIINLPYRDGFISLFIDEVQPEPLVSIYDIDEVKIDLLPMDEYANKKGMSLNASQEADETSIDKVIPNKENKPNEFRSFSGKGNKLGSS